MQKCIKYTFKIAPINYAFGSPMPTRTWTDPNSKYKYGFNGMEKDNDINVDGGSYDFGARIYDSRLGRWLSLDPLIRKYPSLAPYVFCSNSPKIYRDFNGKDFIITTENGGKPDEAGQRFFNLLNERCGGIFVMDNETGIVSFAEGKTLIDIPTGKNISKNLANEVALGIISKQKIEHKIVDDKNTTSIDSYNKGTIDIKDIENMEDPIAQNAMMAHIFAERYNSPDYESNRKATDSHKKYFLPAHSMGIQAEINVISEMTGIDFSTFGSAKDVIETSTYEQNHPKATKTDWPEVTKRTYSNNVVFEFSVSSSVSQEVYSASVKTENVKR